LLKIKKKKKTVDKKRKILASSIFHHMFGFAEYHVGSSLGWSAVFSFKTPPEDLENWQPHLAIYGDMGNVNAQSLARLQEETEAGMYDAILHVGDFAYDFHTVSIFCSVFIVGVH